jgi:hypothetical protein
MKRRMGWFSAVAAGALVLGTLVGFTGAAPASAATETHLCVHAPAGNGDFNVLCIYAPAKVGENAEINAPSASTTNWSYPNTNGATGEIKQANVNLCLQVNASAGGIVRGAKCTDDSAEQWVNFYNSDTHRTLFISLWYLEDSASPDMCLSESSKPLVGVDDCSGNNANEWYMQWGDS